MSYTIIFFQSASDQLPHVIINPIIDGYLRFVDVSTTRNSLNSHLSPHLA